MPIELPRVRIVGSSPTQAMAPQEPQRVAGAKKSRLTKYSNVLEPFIYLGFMVGRLYEAPSAKAAKVVQDYIENLPIQEMGMEKLKELVKGMPQANGDLKDRLLEEIQVNIAYHALWAIQEA
jgi:hypothetical protein